MRRHSFHSLSFGGVAGETATLSGGAATWSSIAVGSAESISQSLAMVRPRGTVALVGMPGRVTVDLAPLWHREVRLAGAYAYGTETVRAAPATVATKAAAATTAAAATKAAAATESDGAENVTTFALAFEVVAAKIDRSPCLGHLPAGRVSKRQWLTPAYGRATRGRPRSPSTSRKDTSR